MRVLFLTPVAGLGGAERALLEMLAALRAFEPDWTIGLIALDDGPPVNFCKPAVDPLFTSAIDIWQGLQLPALNLLMFISVAAAILFAVTLGMRPDVATSITSPRFLFKFVITLSLLASALGLLWNLARPGAIPVGWLLALAAARLGEGLEESVSVAWDVRHGSRPRSRNEANQLGPARRDAEQ